MSEVDEGATSIQPRRIVLHPRTASARKLDRSRNESGEVRGYTTDTAEVMQYMRRHRRTALATFLPVVGAIIALVAVTTLWDGLADTRLAGIPVLWLVLGPITLFSILLTAVGHERRALRLEADWMETRP